MKDTKGLLIMLGAVIIILLGLQLLAKNKQGQTNILSGTLASFNIHLPQSSPAATPISSLKEIKIGNTNVFVSLADNDATRSKGLGGVTNLPANQGMLFVFSSKNIKPSFWMKDMQIPLDFIWISNNKVSEITVNVPAPTTGTPDNQLSVYTPDLPIDYVLEVNAGFVQKNLIKVGDSITNL